MNNVFKLDSRCTNGVFPLTVGTGTISNGNITINDNTWGTTWYPYWTYPPYYPQYTQTLDFQVRKIENGWIVRKNGQEFYCSTREEIAKLID